MASVRFMDDTVGLCSVPRSAGECDRRRLAAALAGLTFGSGDCDARGPLTDEVGVRACGDVALWALSPLSRALRTVSKGSGTGLGEVAMRYRSGDPSPAEGGPLLLGSG